MSHRQLLRKLPTFPFSFSSSSRLPRTQIASRTSPRISPNSRFTRHSSSTSTSTSKSRARFNKVLSRLPRFLHPYTNGLRNAPVSHVVAFLILHEITAIVPLVGLAGLFHYTGWVPGVSDIGRGEGSYVSEGVERFGRYFRRKGWFGFGEGDGDGDAEGVRDINANGAGAGAGVTQGIETGEVKAGGIGIGEDQLISTAEERWGVGEKGGRILVEVATAYALTKIMLPARVLVSVWGTPWFARVFVGRFGRLFGKGRSKGVAGTPGNGNGSGAAAGTGATSGGVGGKRL